MNKTDKIDAIYDALESSVQWSTEELQELRQRAWNRVLDKPRGDEVPGRSKSRSTLIRDTGYAILSTITPAYAGDAIFDFPAEGDDDQADAESNGVNAIFAADDQGFNALCEYMSSALWLRNGVLKCSVVDREDVDTRRFFLGEGETPEMVKIANGGGADWEHIDTSDGVASFKITTQSQELVIDSVDPSQFGVDPNYPHQDLQDCPVIYEREVFTRSQLRQMGVSAEKVNELEALTDRTVNSIGNTSTDAQNKMVGGSGSVGKAATRDQDDVECYWVWMLIDSDGDGIGERWRFLVAGGKRNLLMEDQISLVPYATGTGFPIPNRWSGLGLYDILRHTENNETNGYRQLNDNLNHNNNPRPAADPKSVDFGDLTNAVPAQPIKRKEGAVIDWLMPGDQVSNSIAYLQHLKEVAEDQAGSALQMASSGNQLVKQASGVAVEMQLAPREQMSAYISRNLARTGVCSLGLIIHETLRTQWESPISYYKSGDWQQTFPGEWKKRKKVNIIPGLSPGERRRKASNLQQVIQMQLQLIGGGAANIATNYNQFHNALRDWLDLAEVGNVDSYFLDPDGQESQQGQQQQGQQQQQQSEAENMLTQLQVEMEQHRIQLEAQKLELDRLKIEYDHEDDVFDNETDRLKLAVDAERSADNGQGNTQTESTGAG